MIRGAYVDAAWGQVHLRRAGDHGPWLVLLHESPLSGAVFEQVLSAVAPHVRALAPDNPGYGASDPPPDDGRELTEYADVLATALAAAGVERPVLAGVHTGAALALEIATRLPGGAAGVVLSGLSLITEEERTSYLATWAPEVEVDADGGQFAWAVQRYQRIWPGAEPDVVHLAVMELLRHHDRYRWGYHAAFRHDPAEVLLQAQVPLLLLTPEHDLLADKDSAVLALRPDAARVVLPGLAGQPHLRDPHSYARELLAFVARVTCVS